MHASVSQRARRTRRTRQFITVAGSAVVAAVFVLLGILCLSGNSTTAPSANTRPLAYAGFASERPTADILPSHMARKPAVSQIYVVKPTDSLSALAQRFYKKADCWPVIFAANKKIVPNPNQLPVGVHLTIPRTYSSAACHAPPTVVSSSNTSTYHRVVTAPVKRTPAPAPSGSTYHGGGTLSCSGLEALWVAAGGSRSAAFMAAEIAMAESSGNQYAHSYSNDYGYWQINGSHGSMATYDAMGNARAAVAISSNGSNWNPWTTYRTGAYQGRC